MAIKDVTVVYSDINIIFFQSCNLMNILNIKDIIYVSIYVNT